MVDEIVTPEVAPIAPVEPVAPVVSPEPVSPVEPSPVESPVAPEPTPAPEVAKAETLLGGEKKIEEKSTEEKPVEEKPAEEPAAEPAKEEPSAPVYEPFTLPENATVDPVKMAEFTRALSEFEITTKAPHEEVQKLGQQFLDRHLAAMDRYTESLTQAWNKQKNDWKESFLKDPEFSNRTDTVLNSAIDAINVYGGNAKQQEEFRNLMETTGVGNHPAMIRMLSNIMLAKAEPKPLAAPQIATPMRESKISKMYGKKS